MQIRSRLCPKYMAETRACNTQECDLGDDPEKYCAEADRDECEYGSVPGCKWDNGEDECVPR